MGEQQVRARSRSSAAGGSLPQHPRWEKHGRYAVSLGRAAGRGASAAEERQPFALLQRGRALPRWHTHQPPFAPLPLPAVPLWRERPGSAAPRPAAAAVRPTDRKSRSSSSQPCPSRQSGTAGSGGAADTELESCPLCLIQLNLHLKYPNSGMILNIITNELTYSFMIIL